MNLVMTGDGRFVEVQGTAEGAGAAFDRDLLNRLLDLGAKGCADLTAAQDKALAETPRERLR
jgi:ribonuclease PH